MFNTFPAQFINWQAIPDTPPKKPRKVPCDTALRNINHLDPTKWMTYEQALATGLNVAFVLTENDPYFLLDMDDILLPDGTWDARSQHILQYFSGAAMEVSYSGNGLHIMGQCDHTLTERRVNRWGKGVPGSESNFLEIYTWGRFIALGQGLQGEVNLDWSATLEHIVPARGVSTKGDYRVPLAETQTMDYTGPADDDRLIEMMLKAKGSMKAQFGAKASVAQLWEADETIMATFYPADSSDAYNRSSADAALFAHLAFWTGKNSARMDRLFRRSGLMRAKYEERSGAGGDYDRRTISLAVSGCTSVYSVAPVALPPATQVHATITAAGGYLTIPEQIIHFDKCVYIQELHRILTPDGSVMKPEQFLVMFGGYEFAVTPDGSKPSKSAMDAFTNNRAHHFPKVKKSMFRPELPFQTIEDNAVNIYRDPEVGMVQGDVSRFLDLFNKLLPDPSDQASLMAYCAAIVQHKGYKFLWAPVIQGTKGNGKSMIGAMLDFCVGEDYGFLIDPKKMTGQFNAYLENKIFLTVEEVHMRSKMDILDAVKTLITQDRVPMEGKGADQRKAHNLGNWMLFTNHKDAIIKERDDRRFAMYFTAQQSYADVIAAGMGDDYFPSMWRWLKREGGFEAIHYYLMHYPIPLELNPAVDVGGQAHRAPITSSTNEAIASSLGMLEQEVMEMIEADMPGFRGGYVSSVMLDDMLRERGIKISRNKIADMMLNVGMVPNLTYSRGRFTKGVLAERGLKPVVFVTENSPVDPELFMNYCNAQGYVKL